MISPGLRLIIIIAFIFGSGGAILVFKLTTSFWWSFLAYSMVGSFGALVGGLINWYIEVRQEAKKEKTSAIHEFQNQ